MVKVVCVEFYIGNANLQKGLFRQAQEQVKHFAYNPKPTQMEADKDSHFYINLSNPLESKGQAAFVLAAIHAAFTQHNEKQENFRYVVDQVKKKRERPDIPKYDIPEFKYAEIKIKDAGEKVYLGIRCSQYENPNFAERIPLQSILYELKYLQRIVLEGYQMPKNKQESQATKEFDTEKDAEVAVLFLRMLCQFHVLRLEPGDIQIQSEEQLNRAEKYKDVFKVRIVAEYLDLLKRYEVREKREK